MPYEANSNFGPPPPLMFGGDIEIPNMDGSAMEAEEPHAREYPSDLLTEQNGASGLLMHIQYLFSCSFTEGHLSCGRRERRLGPYSVQSVGAA